MGVSRAESKDGVWYCLSSTKTFQRLKSWIKTLLRLAPGQDRGGEPAAIQLVHLYLLAHLVRHLAGQQLGGGRHPEEGQELLEPADHLRLGVFDIKGSPLQKNLVN